MSTATSTSTSLRRLRGPLLRSLFARSLARQFAHSVRIVARSIAIGYNHPDLIELAKTVRPRSGCTADEH